MRGPKVYEDNSFCVETDKSQISNLAERIKLRFGPLSCTLQDCFGMGFKLRCCGTFRPELAARSIYKVHLIRKSEKYLLGKISWEELVIDKDLVLWVSEKRYITAGWGIAPENEKVIERVLVQDTLVGNRSLYEILTERLNEINGGLNA